MDGVSTERPPPVMTSIPVQLGSDARVEIVSKLTPASVGIHTEEESQSDLISDQYINIHRVPEALVAKGLVTDALPSDLLTHHVVDLGSSADFAQHTVGAQYYDTEDLLAQEELTEDDRRIAAALVAVQLVQQHKQQQPHPVLTADLLGTKQIATSLSPVSTVAMDKPAMAAMVTSYIQAVEEEAAQQQQHHHHHHQPQQHHHSHQQQHHHHQQLLDEQSEDRVMKLYQQPQQDLKLQPLPPLKKVLSSQSMAIRNKYLRSDAIQALQEETPVSVEHLPRLSSEDLASVKNESVNIEEELDSDYDAEMRPSRRSLPHKKRIPKKLKAPPARNIHSKCYKCNKCGDSFSSQAAFAAHRATHNAPTKRLPMASLFLCELCIKQFNSQLKFFEHLKTHYEPPQQQQQQQQQQPVITSLNTQTVMPLQPVVQSTPTLHDAYSVKPESVPVPIKEELAQSGQSCGQCGKVFRRQKALETHISVAHPKQEDIEEFSEPEDMMEGIRHVVNIQGTDSGEEDQCDDKLRQWRYGEVQELGMDLQEMCMVPPGITNNENTEQEKSRPRRNKQLSCPHCNRIFNHRNSLLYHIRSHSGQRPHTCEVCGKSFFAASALKVHLRLHSGDKPYKCEFCGRHFRQWGDLKYHVTSLHSDQKQFQCEYCGKDFARKYSLIVHRRIHTGEKNYKCEFCQKTFRASSYLQNHRRIHTGEKPHPCDVCGKPFRVRSDMKRHRNTHTGERTARRTTAINEVQSEAEEETAQATNEPETIIPDPTPLNLNMRHSDSDDGLTYTREALDRESSTLYVWIPAQPGTLLADE